MIYGTIIIYLLICILLVFFILHCYRNFRPVERDILLHVGNDKAVFKEIDKPVSKPKTKEIVISGNVRKIHVNTRSMTDSEKYLWSVKPNFAWWIFNYGKEILKVSVPELEGKELFTHDLNFHFNKKFRRRKQWKKILRSCKSYNMIMNLYES